MNKERRLSSRLISLNLKIEGLVGFFVALLKNFYKRTIVF